jgi:hypothetical protein
MPDVLVAQVMTVSAGVLVLEAFEDGSVSGVSGFAVR